jgi:hypothetical protein
MSLVVATEKLHSFDCGSDDDRLEAPPNRVRNTLQLGGATARGSRTKEPRRRTGARGRDLTLKAVERITGVRNIDPSRLPGGLRPPAATTAASPLLVEVIRGDMRFDVRARRYASAREMCPCEA